MKNTLKLTLAVIFLFHTAYGQVTCVQAVSETKAESNEIKQIVKRRISEREATEMAQRLIDKKVLISNLQQLAVVFSHADYYVSDYYHDKKTNLDITTEESRAKLFNFFLENRSVTRALEYSKEIPKDLAKFSIKDPGFNEADHKFLEDWKDRSFTFLELLESILDLQADRRNFLLDKIAENFNLKDSRVELLEALREIRQIREEGPEAYNLLKETWKSTIPVAAEIVSKNGKQMEVGEGGVTLTMFLGAGLGIASGFYIFDSITVTAALSTIATTIGGAIGTTVAYDYVVGAVNSLRSISVKKIKEAAKAKVISLSASVLGLNPTEAKVLVDSNTSKTRAQLNSLQDKTTPQLIEILNKIEESKLQNLEDLHQYQRLQMQLMTNLSNQFSILSERLENIRAQSDAFIDQAEKLSRLSGEERRRKVSEISALHSDALEFSLDINNMKKELTETSEYMKRHLEYLRLSLQNENTPKEMRAFIEHLVVQNTVMDGMKEALQTLNERTSQDIETMTKLSVGIMAGQVTNMMKILKGKE